MTHGLLLGGRLLLGGLLLGRGLLLGLLGLGGSGGLLLVFRAELVGGLDLGEIPVGDGLLEGVEEHAIQPLLVFGEVGLHVLLDGNRGRAGAVLQLRDGRDDAGLVRHGRCDLLVLAEDGRRRRTAAEEMRNEKSKDNHRKRQSSPAYSARKRLT